MGFDLGSGLSNWDPAWPCDKSCGSQDGASAAGHLDASVSRRVAELGVDDSLLSS